MRYTYGSKSSSWWRSTLAYAVLKSKCDPSTIVTRLQAVSSDGVTLRHDAPSSIETWITPSSVPTHSIGTRTGDGAIV